MRGNPKYKQCGLGLCVTQGSLGLALSFFTRLTPLFNTGQNPEGMHNFHGLGKKLWEKGPIRMHYMGRRRKQCPPRGASEGF